MNINIHITVICMCLGVEIVKGLNNVTLGTLPTKERNRRLIPYMTFYLGQPQNAQYRQVMAVPYSSLQQQYRPVQQRYIQQPTPLTRMITQNYLALAKHMQGNHRLQTRINPNNYQQEMKYYVAHPGQQVGSHQQQQQSFQYAKPQSTLQYIKQQDEEQYSNKNIDDYDQRNEEHQEDVDYSKPSAASILQYVKPEVQQYVTKFTDERDEQADYDDAIPNNSPLQYITKVNEPQRLVINRGYGKVQYIHKPEESIHAQVQKPIVRYIAKLPGIAGLKLAPQPADIPEYITTPVQMSNNDQTSVTITQSQEIDVDALPSTQSPIPKYHASYVAKPNNYFQHQQHNEEDEEKAEEITETDNVDKNLNDILQGVSLSKSLPERITTENLDSSIKTLSKILRILQRAHSLPHSAKDIVRGFPKPNELRAKPPGLRLQPQLKYKEGSTPGRAGVDYPAYDEIPQTHFSCKEQRYKGFFGDPETGCQVWHYCDLNGGQASFLCPNGTIFSQVALTCDWWFNVKCATTTQLYVLNERLYKYILPQKPSFPEDYSGPLVDHYLTLKFKEIEEKNKNKTEEHKEENKDEDIEPPFSIDEASQNKLRSILIN